MTLITDVTIETIKDLIEHQSGIKDKRPYWEQILDEIIKLEEKQ